MNLKPEKPDESECCGSGCNPCIFDVYEEQLKKWEMNQNIAQNRIALNESKFLPFLITAIESITSQIKAFEFQSIKIIGHHNNETFISNAKSGVDYDILFDNLNLKAGHYLILKGEYVNDGHTEHIVNAISRSYTPVLSDFKKGTFKIIVSLYPCGKMSQFLQKLNVNDVVFWRGPYSEFTYKQNSFQHILLIGGGTGIIPLYNISKEIVENDKEETIIKFLASFKNIESLILRKELNKLQDYWNFKIEIYITNQLKQDYSLKYNEHIKFLKLSKEIIFKELSYFQKGTCFIVICGPELFNKFMYDTILQFDVSTKNVFVFQ